MLAAHLGPNVDIVSATEDSDFLNKLKDREWTVVSFAPGACRWNAAKKPIPGSSAAAGTAGWTLQQYGEKVRELQGEDVRIVETTEEASMVHMLKAAFGV